MIKINLIGEAKRPIASRASALTGGGEESSWPFFVMIGLIGLGILLTAGHFLYVNGKVNGKKDEVAEASREVEELAAFIKEVQEFKAKKAELERKIQVINNLKANQRGPVQVMDQISRALPELLWLTRMQVRGETITLQGQAFNTNAVANFIENLDRVPEFQEPILRETTRNGPVYSFSLTYRFSYTPPPTEEAETTAVAEG
ncbi:MAG: PilN domain-containing protein [Thermoanaerobaculia bacterium]